MGIGYHEEGNKKEEKFQNTAPISVLQELSTMAACFGSQLFGSFSLFHSLTVEMPPLLFMCPILAFKVSFLPVLISKPLPMRKHTSFNPLSLFSASLVATPNPELRKDRCFQTCFFPSKIFPSTRFKEQVSSP